MTFGEKLRQLMAERQISQRRLAKLVPCDNGYLSRVASGQRTPSEQTAQRLDELLDAGGTLAALRQTSPALTTPDCLTPDDHERLALAARAPARLDRYVVDGLAATLASQRRIEDVIGSGAVLEAAGEHLALILRLLRDARGPHVRQLAAVASEASQFNGWLRSAVGAHEEAGPLYDQALRLGLQAASNDLAATALSMRGHLAWICGEFSDMAALSEAAADLATATGTRSVATQQRGRALALAGDQPGALRAVGQAEDILGSNAGTDDPDGLYFYGAELLTMQRGLILAYLAEYARAAELLADGIGALPESSVVRSGSRGTAFRRRPRVLRPVTSTRQSPGCSQHCASWSPPGASRPTERSRRYNAFSPYGGPGTRPSTSYATRSADTSTRLR